MKFSKEIDLRFFQYVRLLRLKLHFATFRNRIRFDDLPEDRPKSGGEVVVFTTADSNYLNRFLRPFVRSAATHMETPHIHVHLYNPQETDYELLKAARQETPAVIISSSSESFSPEARELRSKSSGQQSWKSLYICTSRFLAAQAVRKKFGMALLITDIDVLFNGDVEERFRYPIDVSLLLRPHERNICKRTLGGVVYVSARPIGQQFLERVCRDISRFLAAGFYWFAFDQFALFRAVLAIPMNRFQYAFSPLTVRDICFDLGQDGLILFPKGKLKDEQEFSALVQAYVGKPLSK